MNCSNATLTPNTALTTSREITGLDDLRTRIASAICRWDYPNDENAWETVSELVRDDYRSAADAVIRELLPEREGRWGWLDGTVSTNPATGNPIKLEIEPGEVISLSIDDARDVALALLAAVAECREDSDA